MTLTHFHYDDVYEILINDAPPHQLLILHYPIMNRGRAREVQMDELSQVVREGVMNTINAGLEQLKEERMQRQIDDNNSTL